MIHFYILYTHYLYRNVIRLGMYIMNLNVYKQKDCFLSASLMVHSGMKAVFKN